MDNWNAPQWADFNASLMSDVDEYFNTEHKELEPRYTIGTPYDSFTESPDSKRHLSDSLYNTPKSNGSASPATSGTSAEGNLHLNKTSESLASAMSALRIRSAKKALVRRSVAACVSRVEKAMPMLAPLTNSAVEDVKPVESKTADAQPPSVVDVAGEDCPEIPPLQEEPRAGSTSRDIAVEDNVENNAASVAATNEDDERSTGKAIEKTDAVVNKILEEPEVKVAKVERERAEKSGGACDKQKICIDGPKPEKKREVGSQGKKCDKGKASKPRVLVSQVRRYSISKYRRRSGQYVSLAEAVARFQNGTPKRFRSTNHKDNKAAGGPTSKPKETKMKLTCPMSPALRCKSRVRALPVTNREMEKPVKKVVNNAKPLKRTEKKPATAAPLPLEEKCAMPPPKTPVPPKRTEKTLGEPNFSKDTTIASSSFMSESMRKHTPFKKTVATVVSTDEGVAIKDVEILHFGIPLGNEYKKITRTMPFSFDTRNKESHSKREKLKGQQVEQEKSNKTTFHARPAPSFNAVKKTKSLSKLKENSADKQGEQPTARTALTFHQRNELVLKKKKELMDKMLEQEKQARVFHAKPAPNFKPVFVRGNSAENLRLGDGNRSRPRGISPAGRQKESAASTDQENKPPIVANQQCPKLKNSIVTQNLRLKKTAK